VELIDRAGRSRLLDRWHDDDQRIIRIRLTADGNAAWISSYLRQRAERFTSADGYAERRRLSNPTRGRLALALKRSGHRAD
jgi:hypothetical protein